MAKQTSNRDLQWEVTQSQYNEKRREEKRREEKRREEKRREEKRREERFGDDESDVMLNTAVLYPTRHGMAWNGMPWFSQQTLLYRSHNVRTHNAGQSGELNGIQTELSLLLMKQKRKRSKPHHVLDWRRQYQLVDLKSSESSSYATSSTSISCYFCRHPYSSVSVCLCFSLERAATSHYIT